MGKMKHTPGPWGYDRNLHVVYGRKRYGDAYEVAQGADFEGCPVNDIYEVCRVSHLSVHPYSVDGVLYPVRNDVKQRCRDRLEANARLIVAAPDLLEALKGIMSCTFTGHYNDDREIDYWKREAELGNEEAPNVLAALAAIARAEGRS